MAVEEDDPAIGSAPTQGTAPVDGRPDVALLIATFGFFLITLDILIVNVALTRIGAELGGGTTGQQWVIDGYTLLFASLLLFAGNLSDRFGAKRAIGFGIAGLHHHLAGLRARTVHGGPDRRPLRPGSRSGGDAARVDGPDPGGVPRCGTRAKALGVWAVGGAVAAAVGPLLGGLLTTIDWRWVFWLNLPGRSGDARPPATGRPPRRTASDPVRLGRAGSRRSSG